MVAVTLFIHLGLHGRQQTPNHPWYRVAVGLSFLFFIWLAISTIFSVSLPLSLQAGLEWLFLINVFFWFLEVPWDELDQRFWLIGMLMMGGVLVLLGLAALALPQYSYLVPGMNLIYPTYGHNHLGVVLLLVMPMFWAAAKEWPSKLMQWLAIGFSFTPLMTFGRTIIFLSAAQLGLIHAQVVQKHRWGRWLMRLAVVATVLMVLSQFFLGWYVDQTKSCPFPKFQNQLCKSWKEERRVIYLQQAWEGLQERPWTGFGPGTFGLVSEKFHQLPSFSSAFAHNDYLQFFVEYGLAGGLMFCLGMGWLLYKLRPTTRTKDDPLYLGIYWGLVFVAINSLFDFDFNFIGVMALELMGLALLSKWAKVEPWPTKLSLFEAIVRWWQQWFHTVTLAILLGATLLFIGTNILLDAGKTEWVVRWFPYIPWQSKLMFNEIQKLPPPLQERLRAVYWHHSTLLDDPAVSMAGTATEAALFEHLFVIDPWTRQHKESYSYYLNQGNLLRAEHEIGAANYFFQTKMNVGFGRANISNETKTSLANALMWLADRQFQQGRFGEGVDSMVDAQRYQDWIFNDSMYCNSLPLLYFNSGEDPVVFSQSLAKVPKQFFGQCRPDFATFYLKLYEAQLKTGECRDRCQFYFAEAIGYADWAATDFWTKLMPIHLEHLQQAIKIQDVEWAIRQWRETVAIIKIIDTHNYQDAAHDIHEGAEAKQALLRFQPQIDILLPSLGQENEVKLRQELRDDARWLYTTIR